VKTNYVLIDYENVQPNDIETLQHEHVRVIVFVGPHQTKISFETAAALQRMGKHLQERKLRVHRVQALAEIPILKPPDPKTSSDRLALIVADLQKRGAARPRTVATLSSTISATFQKQLTEQEVSSLVSDLKKKGLIKVEGTKVTYNLPS
jgi:hypothetical protein